MRRLAGVRAFCATISPGSSPAHGRSLVYLCQRQAGKAELLSGRQAAVVRQLRPRIAQSIGSRARAADADAVKESILVLLRWAHLRVRTRAETLQGGGMEGSQGAEGLTIPTAARQRHRRRLSCRRVHPAPPPAACASPARQCVSVLGDKGLRGGQLLEAELKQCNNTPEEPRVIWHSRGIKGHMTEIEQCDIFSTPQLHSPCPAHPGPALSRCCCR